MCLRLAIVFIFITLLLPACKQKERAGATSSFSNTSGLKQDYLSFIIALDTLPSAEIKKVVYHEDSLLSSSNNKDSNPFYYYFKALKFSLDNNKDSSLVWYEKMDTKENKELQLLKTFSIIHTRTKGNGIVEAAWLEQTLEMTKQAEATNSKITYLFYDLLARLWYQNGNIEKAKEYNELYYKNHPFGQHPVVQQRYYDISFLLSAQEKDYKNMLHYNNKARELAMRIHDSAALARTYDNEAQLYARLGRNDKAVECSRRYFDYLQQSNQLNDVAYHNLGTSFMNNRQYDSAIKYYRQAIAFKKKENRMVPIYYRNLISAYKAKGDIAQALTTANVAYATEINSIKEIEATKVAELHEQYQAEKKDANIKALNATNQLNKKIIAQQRWILVSAALIFAGVLSFLYVIYRQRLLKGKNRLLQSENNRMRIEQKLLQTQLNPHFIFNALTNLQSLVASGHSREAKQYLLSFSQLLRNILEQSRKDFIELDEEIISLHNYLQLQQMRFTGLFAYEIIVDKNIDATMILIPPMLLQPFVENAIEHGFKGIDYLGKISVSFVVQNHQLLITIDDNGIGLQEKKVTASQHKQSLAQLILKERLDALFTVQGQEANYTITDKKHGSNDSNEYGVVVKITLPEINT